MITLDVKVKGEKYKVQCFWVSPTIPIPEDPHLKRIVGSIKIFSIKDSHKREATATEAIKDVCRKEINKLLSSEV